MGHLIKHQGRNPVAGPQNVFALATVILLKVSCGLQERDDLVQAGLGEKKVVIPENFSETTRDRWI